MEAPKLMRVKQFVEEHPEFSKGQLNNYIFHRKNNGLAAAGAVVKMGRGVYLNVPKFFDWVLSHTEAA